jgi:DNA-binding transcriptional LysR family regulator
VVHVDGDVSANNAETVLQLAVAGVGITRLTDVVVAESIRSGALVPILTDWHHVEPVPLYATYPGGRNLAPKVRAMVDFLVQEFGSAPWRRARPAPPTGYDSR